MNRWITVALATMAAGAPVWATHAVGTTPPDFNCVDTDGNATTLYEQRGKVVLINFGATW